MTDTEINEAVAKKLGHSIPSGMVFPISMDYCHNVKAAWEIVEWLRIHNYCVVILSPGGTDFFNYFVAHSEWRVVVVESLVTAQSIVSNPTEAETAPMAICLAFLKLP